MGWVSNPGIVVCVGLCLDLAIMSFMGSYRDFESAVCVS